MTEEDSPFERWAGRWMDLAGYRGREVPDADERIEDVVKLWHEAIPGGWARDQDVRLLDPDRRYCRTHTGGAKIPRGEHAIEYEILGPSPTETTTICLGARLVDGINAVPLAKDVGGGRAGNVEADMLLLVRNRGNWAVLLVEVKSESDNAWYAAVENLRQLRLFSESHASQRLFHTRCPRSRLPDSLPATTVVLAPRVFFTAPGAKAAAVAPATKLLERMHAETGIAAELATWDPDRRAIEELRPG